jgi:hypothetical protein
MNDKETLQAIGRLIKEAHSRIYPSRRQFAILTEVDVKTIIGAEKGERELHPTTQRKIEKALGWRRGSIDDVWQHRSEIPAESLTIDEMERGVNDTTWEEMETRPMTYTKASQLTDEELLAELSYRFRNYKVRLNGES